MTFDRRRFLKSVSAGAAGISTISTILSVSDARVAHRKSEGLETTDGPIFNLGLASYSFNRNFEFNKSKP